jgi:hypothetical protein
VLGYEGKGSLLSFLKQQGLAEGLSSFISSAKFWRAFGVSVSLTEDGLLRCVGVPSLGCWLWSACDIVVALRGAVGGRWRTRCSRICRCLKRLARLRTCTKNCPKFPEMGSSFVPSRRPLPVFRRLRTTCMRFVPRVV